MGLEISLPVCTNEAGNTADSPHHTCSWPLYRLVTKSPPMRMPSGVNEFVSQFIYKLVHTKLWKKYQERRDAIIAECGDANERMLFHGSYAAFPIAVIGFDIEYANKDGLFGAAIYFAEDSSKSNQYVHGYMGGDGCDRHKDKNCRICPRIMLLCRVALGRVYTVTTDQDEGATVRKELPSGYHSIEGVPSRGGLRYPEYAVYKGEQI